MKKALLLSALIFSLLACATLSAPTPVPTSTHVPSASSTPIPTLSPAPSASSSPAPTPLPTFAVVLPSPVPSPTATRELDCQLNWQSPGNYITYEPGDSFTTGWKLTNIGSAVWDPGSVEFTYLAGAKLYDDPVVHLRASVTPGQTVILSVAMTAPKKPNMYTTRWGLRKGDTYFCPVSVSIYVQ